MRKGIMSAGNWLVDILKFITTFPAIGNLTTIEKEEFGLGGCSHNVLVDLAKMQAGLPLHAGGCVGNDEYGNYILQIIRQNHIDDKHMYRIDKAPTAYTDVMIPLDDCSRTYFHNRGANALLDVEHFENMDTDAKIFHLGYLLLLDKLDEEDPDYGIKAARVLHRLQQKGYKTSVDVVSEEGERFKKILLPCLPYINYLIVNEIEAGKCVDDCLRDSQKQILRDRVELAAKKLLDAGVNEVCAIHFPEGGFAIDKNGASHYEPSRMLSTKEVVSTVGAGDAFCAGMLYALHEEFSMKDALIFANTSARFNLRHASCTGGAPTLQEINGFIQSNYYEKK